MSLSGEVSLLLPGHNDLLTRHGAVVAAERYIDNHGAGRIARKWASRTRARLVVGAHTCFALPEATRELISS